MMISFENICSVQHEACLTISPHKQQKGQCWCSFGRKPASEGQRCCPGLLEELGHSPAHRSVNKTVTLWGGLSASINLKISLKKCSLVFKSPLWPEKVFFKKTYTLKKYINDSDTRGKKKGRKKRMQMAKSLWEERVFFKHEPTSRK